ncbi:MAG: hypoxanthine phosphoribosyltransferase [Planctomycetes bacterium]|nr:hypoxanthine phosphoribosyltransferase [Planctomycetota bacterium]
MQSDSPAARASLGRVLVSAEQIRARMPELARDIQAWVGDGEDEVVLVPVMTGAFIFAADLVRHMPVRMRISLVTVSSYPGASTTSQGVRPLGELPANLEGRRVLVIDDVLDSGRTLRFLREQFASQRPARFATAVLLRKTIPAALETPCEFVGFDIPDEFVVGCGLDFDGCFRNLPDVRVLHPKGTGA